MFDRITGCRVVVESPHNKRAKGHTYHVTIEVNVPSEMIVVNRDPQNHDHDDLGIALRDAFAAEVARGDVRVAVFDALGREVAVLTEGRAEPGRQSVTLDASRFAPGTYVVRLDAGGETFARRIVIAR